MSGAVLALNLAAYRSTIFLMLSALVIAIGVPLAYRYWRDMHEDDEPIRNADLLSDLERGGAANKMTEDEFHRVRELLLGAEAAGKPPDKSRRGVRGRPEEKDREGESGAADE
jgi:hypothetical protein